MNLLTKLFNSMSKEPPSSPAKGSAAAAANDFYEKQNAALAQSTPQKAPPAKGPPPADDFERRFKRAPYWRENCAFPITRKFVEEIARRAGVEIFSKEERQQLTDLSKRFDVAHKRLSEVGHDAVQRRFVDLIRSSDAAIGEGDAPEIGQHRDDVQKEIALQRQMVRGELRGVGVLTLPLLQTICRRMAQAARKVAVELDDAEAKAADPFGAPRFPSPQLVITVYLALEGFEKHVGAAVPGAWFNPGDVLWGCLHKDS